jgi:hypothetical protein
MCIADTSIIPSVLGSRLASVCVQDMVKLDKGAVCPEPTTPRNNPPARYPSRRAEPNQSISISRSLSPCAARARRRRHAGSRRTCGLRRIGIPRPPRVATTILLGCWSADRASGRAASSWRAHGVERLLRHVMRVRSAAGLVRPNEIIVQESTLWLGAAAGMS